MPHPCILPKYLSGLPIIDKYCAESIVFRTGHSGKTAVNVTWSVFDKWSLEPLQFTGCHGSILNLPKNDKKYNLLTFALTYYSLRYWWIYIFSEGSSKYFGVFVLYDCSWFTSHFCNIEMCKPHYVVIKFLQEGQRLWDMVSRSL